VRNGAAVSSLFYVSHRGSLRGAPGAKPNASDFAPVSKSPKRQVSYTSLVDVSGDDGQGHQTRVGLSFPGSRVSVVHKTIETDHSSDKATRAQPALAKAPGSRIYLS
jgi:hypothetical protein